MARKANDRWFWTRNNGRKIERCIASKQIKWSSNLDSYGGDKSMCCAARIQF